MLLAKVGLHCFSVSCLGQYQFYSVDSLPWQWPAVNQDLTRGFRSMTPRELRKIERFFGGFARFSGHKLDVSIKLEL